MTDLLQLLCGYARDRRLPAYLAEIPQYQEIKSMARQNCDALRRLLSEEGRLRLENCAGEEEFLRGLELDAMFRAGLTMGLELSRL